MDSLVKHSVPDARDFFVCPICRMAFAVERPAASAVVCPGCEHLLSVDKQDAGIKSANQLLVEFDESRKVEWERDQKPAVVKSSAASLLMWAILSSCVLVAGYVTALVLTGQENEVNQPVEPLDYAAMARVQGEKFCQCNTLEEFWPLLDQAAVSKQMVEDYLGYFQRSAQSMRVLQVRPEEGTEAAARVVVDLQTNHGVRQVLIKFEGDKAMVDWLSFSGQNPNGHKGVTADKTEVLRCVVNRANNYDFSFPEEDWYCVQLSFIQEPVPVYGYVARDQKGLWQQIRLLLELRDTTMAILKVRKIQARTGDEKFQVMGLVADNWVLPE